MTYGTISEESEVINMIKGLTIRLYPTTEQEVHMRQHIGCQRFIYNWGLAKNNELYKAEKKKYSTTDLGKILTQFKKEESVNWLNEVSNATLRNLLNWEIVTSHLI